MSRASDYATFSKSIAFIGVFSALYAAGGLVTGFLSGPLLRGYPTHFLRGWFMSSVAAYSRRMWSATAMGLIAGIVFLITIPAPAPYLLASSLAAGLVYDLSLRLGNHYSRNARGKRRIIFSTTLSGVAESVTALSILTLIGLFQVTPVVLLLIWIIGIALNILISNIGALLTVLLIRRGVF